MGEFGDPRLEQKQGPYGRYLLPPLIDIPPGGYSVGSDDGLYENVSPVHTVKTDAFSLAKFPVPNAEWGCFIGSSGYEEEQWRKTNKARSCGGAI